MLNVIIHSVDFIIVMLNIIMLNVVMLSVVILSVVMLSVVTPIFLALLETTLAWSLTIVRK
jgi:hypothetical protein